MGRKENQMSSFIIIDGNSLMFRAYYALNTPMSNREGVPTGAIHGFLSMLLKLLERDPSYLAVAFDRKEPTFRHKTYQAYKAGRKPTPPDLLEQMPILREVLEQMGIRVLDCPGYEADDILGTLSRRAESEGIDTLLVTGDRDALQLVTDSVHVLLTKRGITDTVEYTPETLSEVYGLTPAHMKDLKALMGDASDNIPGIPGVGEKTALKLLGEYGDLEGVLSHGEVIKGKLGEKVRSNAESARLSYWLGTISTEAPVDVDLNGCFFSKESMANARDVLEKLELRSILNRLPQGVAPVRAVPVHKNVSLDSLEALEDLVRAHMDCQSLAVLVAPSFSIAFDGETSYDFSLQNDLFSAPVTGEMLLSSLSPLMEKTHIWTYDGKALLHSMNKAKIPLRTVHFDARIADYLLASNRPSGSYETLCRERLGGEVGAAGLFLLQPQMETELKEKGMEKLYAHMEMPLMEVLFSMEQEGFALDGNVLKALHCDFSVQQKELEEKIYALAGERFNILSPKQLGGILFDKLGLPHGKKTKSGYSTDSDTLEAIADRHPIVPLIGEYRFLSKVDATFVEGLLKATGADGRVHSSFNQCVTATGRISSTEPNLQNIPVRTPQGAQIRKAFVASPGHVLVGADYSQIELRLLAHMSGDPGLINAFNSGEDIHRHTASEVFHTPLELVTREQRSAAKAVNFGIVYGISDFGLARNLNIPVKVAGSYIDMYLDRYPGVRAYMKESVEKAKSCGYAQTLYGRRRPLPELKSSNYNTRNFGERVAMNMPIQGSAADIIKIAMVRVYAALKEKGLAARLILQIHDELLVDAPLEEAEMVKHMMEDTMEHVAELKVKLIAQASCGSSWYDTK